jgi:hypothetical protein
MTKEIKNWYDRTDMKKLALKATTSNPAIVDAPESFLPDFEHGIITSDVWVEVEIKGDLVGDGIVPAVLEFQADP